MTIDIGSGTRGPGGQLSNFRPRRFVFDGVECASMEGLLQAFKKRDVEMQEHVCGLVGRDAKRAGGTSWQRDQTLHWKGVAYPRKSEAYQDLLDRAFDALATNMKFRLALLSTGDAVLAHSHGAKKGESETCLTTREFVSRLTKIRERIRRESV